MLSLCAPLLLFIAPKETDYLPPQNRADDAVCLVFWLYNTTIWLHLMKCDESINEACEMMGLFELIEEVINSIFGTTDILCSSVEHTSDPSMQYFSSD